MPQIRRKFKFIPNSQTVVAGASELGPIDYFGAAKNLDIRHTDFVRGRRSSHKYSGFSAGGSIHSVYFYDSEVYIGRGTIFAQLDDIAGEVSLRTSLNGSKLNFATMAPAQGVTADHLYVSGGGVTNGFFKMSPSESFARWGIAIPAQGTFAAASGGAGILTGTYRYRVTFGAPAIGIESNPNPTDVTFTASSNDIDLSNIPVSADSQVAVRYLYRTVGNGATFFLLTTINDNTTTTYTDNTADADLEPQELLFTNTDPSDNTFDFRMHVGPHAQRMWWSLATGSSGAFGARVYYSRVGFPESLEGFIDLGSTENSVKSLVIWNGALWVCTPDMWYEVIGDDEPFAFRPVYGTIGTYYRQTIQPTPNGIIYIDRDGDVRLFDGTTSSAYMRKIFGDTLRGYAESLLSDEAGTWSRTAAALNIGCSTWGRDEYIISDGTQVGAYGILLGQEQPKVRRIEIGSASSSRFISAAHTTKFGDILLATGEGDVFTLEANVTNGIQNEKSRTPAYVAEWSAVFSDVDRLGILQRIYLDAQIPVEMTLTVFNEAGTSLLTATLATSTVRTKYIVPCGKIGRVFRVRVSGNSQTTTSSSRFEVYDLEAEYYVPPTAQVAQLR